jgi:uncharacterized protein (TIGR03086 family)
MGIRGLNAQASALTGGIVSGLTSEQFDLATPCSGWTVRDVIDHMVGNNRAILIKLLGDSAPTIDLGDLQADFVESEHAVAEAFSTDELFARPVELRGWQLTGRIALSVHFTDILVHAWDIGSAVGVDVRFDDDLAEAALGIVGQFPAEAWGEGSAFTERLPVADGASAQERLLAMTGRARVASAV